MNNLGLHKMSHRDEVGAPDGDAGRNRRQDMPAQLLHAGGAHRALEQPGGHPGTHGAQ